MGRDKDLKQLMEIINKTTKDIVCTLDICSLLLFVVPTDL